MARFTVRNSVQATAWVFLKEPGEILVTIVSEYEAFAIAKNLLEVLDVFGYGFIGTALEL